LWIQTLSFTIPSNLTRKFSFHKNILFVVKFCSEMSQKWQVTLWLIPSLLPNVVFRDTVPYTPTIVSSIIWMAPFKQIISQELIKWKKLSSNQKEITSSFSAGRGSQTSDPQIKFMRPALPQNGNVWIFLFRTFMLYLLKLTGPYFF